MMKRHLLSVLQVFLAASVLQETLSASSVKDLQRPGDSLAMGSGVRNLTTGLRAGTGAVYQSAIYRGKTWKNGVVFYTIDDVFDSSDRRIIHKAMADIESKTCIRFQPSDPDTYHINIIRGGGCYSMVGVVRYGSKLSQSLSLGKGCVRHRIIVHEFMHSLGFHHEHKRWDRDDYLDVYMENIRDKKYRVNFVKERHRNIPGWDQFKYDYASVLHYTESAFAKKGLLILVPKQPGVIIGRAKTMSQTDVAQINYLYNCPQTDTTTTTTTEYGSTTTTGSTRTTTPWTGTTTTEHWGTTTTTDPGLELVGDKLPPAEDLLRNLTLFIGVKNVHSFNPVSNGSPRSFAAITPLLLSVYVALHK